MRVGEFCPLITGSYALFLLAAIRTELRNPQDESSCNDGLAHQVPAADFRPAAPGASFLALRRFSAASFKLRSLEFRNSTSSEEKSIIM